MKHKPLSPEEKAAAKQLVKDKTLPLRIRFFSEWFLTILLGLGVLTLIGYGGVYVWSLLYVKEKADGIEQRLQDHIKETQRDAEQ